MKLLYATTNIHKLRGANRALAGTGIELMLPSIDLPDVPEIQSDDQTEVSVDKAIKYHALLRCPVVVMDSGLFIEPLGGFPGVYTKYVLDVLGIDKLVDLTRNIEKPVAFTQRTITYFDGVTLKTFSSKVTGTLVREPRGMNGRNYDKYFVADGRDKTIAEFSDEEQTALTAPVWQEFAAWVNKHKKDLCSSK